MNTYAWAVNCLEAYLPAKSALVESLTKSWALTPSCLADLPTVTEEQLAIAEVQPSFSPRLSSLSVFLSLSSPAKFFDRPLPEH